MAGWVMSPTAASQRPSSQMADLDERPLRRNLGGRKGSKAPSENLRDRTLALAVLIILIRESPAAAVADKPRFPANWRTAA